jgi:hypothetical protein
MRTSLKAWILALATTAAAPVTYALPRERFKAPIGAWRFFSSDASKEGTLTPGIAGYMHGVFWVHLYPSDWLWLPIAVLEFIALAVSIIVFAPLLDSTPHIVMETDSLTTALVLSADSAKSPLLVEAHALLLATPEYTSLLTGLHSWRQVEVGHIYGPANIAADYLSRGNTAAFTVFCTNMNVSPQPLPISPAAWDYLHRFFEAVDPRH